jgi:hypothetical protein
MPGLPSRGHQIGKKVIRSYSFYLWLLVEAKNESDRNTSIEQQANIDVLIDDLSSQDIVRRKEAPKSLTS